MRTESRDRDLQFERQKADNEQLLMDNRKMKSILDLIKADMDKCS